MKNRATALPLLILLSFTGSCKKESSPCIVGKWISVSAYSFADDGSYQWISTEDHSEALTFSAQGTFGSRTDVPGVSGTYIYEQQSHKLILDYGADAYGNAIGTMIFKVEELNNDRLILASYPSTASLPYKTEYSRFH